MITVTVNNHEKLTEDFGSVRHYHRFEFDYEYKFIAEAAREHDLNEHNLRYHLNRHGTYEDENVKIKMV